MGSVTDLQARTAFMARYPLGSRVRAIGLGAGTVRGYGGNLAYVAFDSDGPFEVDPTAARPSIAGCRVILFESIEPETSPAESEPLRFVRVAGQTGSPHAVSLVLYDRRMPGTTVRALCTMPLSQPVMSSKALGCKSCTGIVTARGAVDVTDELMAEACC